MMIAALVLLCLLKFVFKDSIPKAKKKITKAAKQVATTTKKSTPLVKEEAAIAYSQLSAAKYLMGAPSDVSLAMWVQRQSSRGLVCPRRLGGEAHDPICVCGRLLVCDDSSLAPARTH